MVPWTEDDEEEMLGLVPLLSCGEEAKDLVARISVTPCETKPPSVHMTSKDLLSWKTFEFHFFHMKGSLEDYSRPSSRGGRDETEAIQRQYLHTAMDFGKELLLVVESIVELRLADSAVKHWCRQASFTETLHRLLRDDLLRDAAPGLPGVIMNCTSRIASCIITGDVWTPRQMRLAFVRDWLPVFIICRDTPSPEGSNHTPLYRELEETFLKIISTLPMPDAKGLLEQCHSFANSNIDDCPHLTAAITTWSCRAKRTPLPDISQ